MADTNFNSIKERDVPKVAMKKRKVIMLKALLGAFIT